MFSYEYFSHSVTKYKRLLKLYAIIIKKKKTWSTGLKVIVLIYKCYLIIFFFNFTNIYDWKWRSSWLFVTSENVYLLRCNFIYGKKLLEKEFGKLKEKKLGTIIVGI